MTVVVCPVRNGKPDLGDMQRQVMDAAFKQLEGQDCKITIGKDKRNRTLSQNSYYWSVVLTMIAAETGHTTEDIHEFCKWQFLPRQFIHVGSEERYISKSTTRLSTDEFSDYIERIKAFAAAELSLAIPSPDEL